MESIELKSLMSQLEAVLFVYGEPITKKKLAQILDIKEEEIVNVLEAYKIELDRNERGLMLVQKDEKIQLTTKKEFSDLLNSLFKKEFIEDLTPATVETLSIIAYAGPVTRADIEYIRGVNSSFIIRNLMMRGLIERSVSEQKSNTFVYSISFDLLKRLGISSIDSLPEYKKFNELVRLLHEEIENKEKVTSTETNTEKGGVILGS